MIIPIVSLDKIYINPDDENIYFLDCTRIADKNSLISRRGYKLDVQIRDLSNKLKKRDVILADDVVFSGSVLKNIINMFNLYGINVVGVIASICMKDAYDYFNLILKYGIKVNYLMSNDVIDQICERDFYFGIVGSGIMVYRNSRLYKAPYFKPFGNPYERASIPLEFEKKFSLGCLDRSIYLWEEIDRMRNGETMIYELPERIVDTDINEGVVRCLKKVRNSL